MLSGALKVCASSAYGPPHNIVGPPHNIVIQCECYEDHFVIDMSAEDCLQSSFLVLIGQLFLYQVNSSPYEKGWIIKVEINDSGELKNLMDSDKYTKFCEEEDAH